MIAFQLDQCLDSKRFAGDCAAEGLCQTLRLPTSLRHVEDPELLQALMGGTNPLVSFDRALPHQHTSSIPENHPGIIVVSNFPAPQTMTISIAQRVLERFKVTFPDWHRVSWAKSVVEITTLGVEVWHVFRGRLVQDAYIAFDAADWPSRLLNILEENSQCGSASNFDPSASA